jgi:hypothetical protein
MTGRAVVVAGSLAQKPCQGGHTWQFLQYLLGLKRLGWEVLFLDRLEPEMCVNDQGHPSSLEDSVNLRYFLHVLDRFGLAGSFSLIFNRGQRFVGLSRRQVLQRCRKATFLLNVMGFLDDAEILAAVPRRVCLDTDPGFGQMWQASGLAELFKGHDDYVTIAQNIGQPSCTIPTCGIHWITWRQPIVLSQWPCAEDPSTRFTSIGAWRGPYGPVEYRGQIYGLRIHEFRKFLGLPGLTGEEFEVALDIHRAEVRDLEALQDNGWRLADPKVIARDPWIYRQYIQNSRGEFMATKGMYVHTRSGWFSERSICYLASGRPVLAQDTGLKNLYPTGEGLILFSTLEEAAEGVRRINADYARHCRAARAIAQEYFDSDKVLTQLLRKLNIA